MTVEGTNKMQTVYVVGILAAAIVVLVIGWIYRNRLVSGSVKVGRRGFEGGIKAKNPSGDSAQSRGQRPTGIHRLLMVLSRITYPVGSLMNVSRTRMFGSKIEVRDARPTRSSDEPDKK
jgi:hypothetical protein